MTDVTRTEIRNKWPNLTRDLHKSRKAAITLFCIECMGGNRAEVARCTATECPLYRWRPGAARNGQA